MSNYEIIYACGSDTIHTRGIKVMATIKDVAKLAGVGTSTVSRYLNTNGYISEEARIKIRRACDELNYTPNELARAMKRNHSMTIGVMIPTICK